MVKIALIASLMILTACQTIGGSFCSISKPFRPSQATIDAMSDQEVADMLAFNLKGKKLCGWKP
ncbi:hypothetical protein CU102_12035 [Phyllobacterium brassicacearum]|uniref:Lipoprotein n=1 Tax=Phyllobacterium brassicacearum TaxID=314235 RepID=A0A2P7BPU8_9HYPH|nr:hypothetical protein [Phyllobacterium brassicacearum]PSH68501.1 hypothetical protein CU102_12035 [Phyllobacterium brassicacearum]TDQ19830.1 hypothetical protein DEV91_12422 [Phyllobacterium brassicacearum]